MFDAIDSLRKRGPEIGLDFNNIVKNYFNAPSRFKRQYEIVVAQVADRCIMVVEDEATEAIEIAAAELKNSEVADASLGLKSVDASACEIMVDEPASYPNEVSTMHEAQVQSFLELVYLARLPPTVIVRETLAQLEKLQARPGIRRALR